MLREEQNIANIFFPYCKSESEIQDGILVGFNYEGFLFVIVAVVPLDLIPEPSDKAKSKVELLNTLISEHKQLTEMNTYCAGELIILGVIEHAKGKLSLQKH